MVKKINRRSLRGNVDRNKSKVAAYYNGSTVVPYVGTWIEILWHTERHELCHPSFPTWERG